MKQLISERMILSGVFASRQGGGRIPTTKMMLQGNKPEVGVCLRRRPLPRGLNQSFERPSVAMTASLVLAPGTGIRGHF